ncbi:MAG: hypothetical protein Q8R08_03610 [bacterium]|nr:hypothetical protein [bacterium]
MTLKTRVGQIFLEHPKDENYSSIYEETFTKQGQAVQLFAAMEIAESSRTNQIKNRKLEYEALTRAIVGAFKKTYVSAVEINEDTFERSLAAINATLGKLGAKGKVNWFGKLNVSLGAFCDNELCLSSTGNAVVYLIRGKNASLLSEGLADDSMAVKIFSNYGAGKLRIGDRIILSTKQLFNYLSLDKMREILQESDLDEICHEIISGLADIKNIGFATFVFETFSENAAIEEVPKKPLFTEPVLAGTQAAQKSRSQSQKTLRIVFAILKGIFEFLINLFRMIFSFIYRLMSRRSRPGSKKPLILTVGVIILLLALSIGFSVWQRGRGQSQKIEQSNLTRAEEIVNQAEATAIYQDDEGVLKLIDEAQILLSDVTSDKNSAAAAALNDRIKSLKDKINKEVVIDNPTVLSTFPMVPTNLARENNGFLAFNRNTGILAFYDFRNGETKEILADKNTSSLVLGGYIGGAHSHVFLNKSGTFTRVDVSSNTLSEYLAVSPNLAGADKAKLQDVAILGSANNARLYFLDTNQNQIWRFRITDDATIGLAEGWLKAEAALGEARDISIDNNIYVLFADHLNRYFNGQAQNFTLSAVSPAISDAQKVFTTPEQQMIYILEPSVERVLVYNKTGRLQTQIKSPKLRDAADLFVDEKAKIIYVTSGAELLQINF